jgi:hypothetical protein
MGSFELDIPASRRSSGGGESARIVDLAEVRDRREPIALPCDDLRQWTVVIWARTKLIERELAAGGAVDPRLLAGLADINAAVAAIGARLDALEDARPAARSGRAA